MSADTRWYEAKVTRDISCDDLCPRCRGREFNCTECSDGRAVSHMWGFSGRGKPFFAKDTRVIVARCNSWFTEHDWNGVHMSYQYPERYWIFEPYRSGKKIIVMTAYAIEHVARIRPLKDMTKIGEEALEEYAYQMSR